MKTIFKTKTERNIQETISKSLAVIIIIALVSVSLNAQDLDYLFPEKSRIHESTLAMLTNTAGMSRVANNANTFSASFETATEETLEIESWMLNESNFSAMPIIETESESAMEIESWMTDENTFKTSTPSLIEETENALVIENWMLTENAFSTSKCAEQPLNLEHWMISELTWK